MRRRSLSSVARCWTRTSTRSLRDVAALSGGQIRSWSRAIPDHVVDLHVWRTFSHKSPTTEACQTYFEAGRNFVFPKKGFHIHLAFVLKAPACLHRVGDRGVQALNILRFYVSVKFRDSLSPSSLFDWLASNGGVTMLSSASRFAFMRTWR
jgi:hypothetical protein